MASETRFFCRCGRLLVVDAATREVICATCRDRNVVPTMDARTAARPSALPPPLPRAAAPAAPDHRPAVAVLADPAAATAVLELRIGGRLGRFELVRLLGQGGMGAVYHARDAGGTIDIALKVLHPVLQSRPDFVSRFQRESKAAARLNHENICRVLDAGIERGSPWIAMELIEGDDLLAAAQRGLVTVDNVVRVMLQAARGLEAAAAQGITHRDVKPSNFVLRRDGVLKIADFGLAKALDASTQLTVTGEVLGTPHYMAPEQGRGERVDHRADLYSLGATFYHVLGGAPPHQADSPVAVIMKHLREEPLPLRARNGRVSPAIERVVHRLLQKSAEQRYQSYTALIDDLERVAAGNEPLAGADPPARRVQSGDTTFLLPHEETTEFVLNPAGALRRLLAFAVDVITLEATLRLWIFVTHWIFGVVNGKPPPSRRLIDVLFPALESMEPTQRLLLAATCLASGFFYFSAADARGGRTLGKRWLNLRICKRDGSDLGVGRAMLRTLLVLPAIVVIVPTLTDAFAHLLNHPELVRREGNRQALLGAGLAWLLALDFLGRLSAHGRPLHDVLAGSVAWRAHRSRPLALPAWRPRKEASPLRAALLSVIPGLGVIATGQWLLGLAFAVAIVVLLIQLPPAGIGLWVVSGCAAVALAVLRRRAARTPAGDLDPVLVRRQES